VPEPVNWPVKLYLLLDNGTGLGSGNVQLLKGGVAGLIEALPANLEVTLVSTAPRPRILARATTDRAALQKGLDPPIQLFRLLVPAVGDPVFAVMRQIDIAGHVGIDGTAHQAKRFKLTYNSWPILPGVASELAHAVPIRADGVS
jgi:hypothetical protein